MKRFYSLVSTKENSSGKVQVLLDGKVIKMPSGDALIPPNQKIADLIMQEWAAQEEKIVPDDMPITQILTTVLDRVCVEKEAMMKAVLNFADTDLVFYRTELPEALREKQEESWDPWIRWIENEISEKLLVTTGLSALKQPKVFHDYIQNEINQMDDYYFGIMQLLVSITGSVILSFAFLQKKLEAKGLLDAIRVEENYKATIYNETEHGLAPHEELILENISKELEAAQKFLENI